MQKKNPINCISIAPFMLKMNKKKQIKVLYIKHYNCDKNTEKITAPSDAGYSRNTPKIFQE